MNKFTSITAGDKKLKVPNITSQQLTELAAKWKISKRTAVEIVIAQAYGAEFGEALSMEVVADCGRCGDAINATEPEIYWDGERVCESCGQLAKAAAK